MSVVDQQEKSSLSVPLRCPVPRAGENHVYVTLGSDVGVCGICGVEVGTAASTWPCGQSPTPMVRLTYDESNVNDIRRVELVDMVEPSLLEDVELKIRDVEANYAVDDTFGELGDLIRLVRTLIEHLPTA